MSCDYFPPTYFTAAYFSNLATADPTVPPVINPGPAPRGRDRDAYRAILDALGATRAFDQITFGPAGPRNRGGANRYPALLLSPKDWREDDDADPISVVRRSRFTITIRVRDDEPLDGFHRLDELAALAIDAIDQSDLDGTVLPALTKVRAGRYIPAATPELGVELVGEFSILYAYATS